MPPHLAPDGSPSPAAAAPGRSTGTTGCQRLLSAGRDDVSSLRSRPRTQRRATPLVREGWQQRTAVGKRAHHQGFELPVHRLGVQEAKERQTDALGQQPALDRLRLGGGHDAAVVWKVVPEVRAVGRRGRGSVSKGGGGGRCVACAAAPRLAGGREAVLDLVVESGESSTLGWPEASS